MIFASTCLSFPLFSLIHGCKLPNGYLTGRRQITGGGKHSWEELKVALVCLFQSGEAIGGGKMPAIRLDDRRCDAGV